MTYQTVRFLAAQLLDLVLPVLARLHSNVLSSPLNPLAQLGFYFRPVHSISSYVECVQARNGLPNQDIAAVRR